MRKVLKSEKIFPKMVELRRAIHSYPELAFKEEKTAGLIMNELKRLGIPCEYNGLGGGVIARIGRDNRVPTVALRAEMDGLPFSSKNRGKMHVCGHDGHITIVLGAAALLREHPPQGNVVLIFQPGEESGAGSKKMIKGGVSAGCKWRRGDKDCPSCGLECSG